MSKCWGQPRKRRVSKGHGKEGRSGGLGTYRTKPSRGHQWVVDRDADGNKIPGTRRCAKCGLPPPGRGDSPKKSPVHINSETGIKRKVTWKFSEEGGD
jgi:hypothetical protein